MSHISGQNFAVKGRELVKISELGEINKLELVKITFANGQVLRVSKDFILPGIEGPVLAESAWPGLVLKPGDNFSMIESPEVHKLSYCRGYLGGSSFGSIHSRRYNMSKFIMRNKLLDKCSAYLIESGYIAEVDYCESTIKTNCVWFHMEQKTIKEHLSFLAGFIDACGRVSGKRLHIDFTSDTTMEVLQNQMAALNIQSSVLYTTAGRPVLNIWTGASYHNANLEALYNFSELATGQLQRDTSGRKVECKKKNPYVVKSLEIVESLATNLEKVEERVLNLGFIQTLL